jgi:hypothetical protein
MSEYIKIGDKEIIVGLNWSDKEGKNKRQIISEIKKEAKDSNSYYGYFSDTKNKNIQYVLFSNSNDNISVGSAIVSDLFKDVVFVKKITTENINTTKYWVCAVDNDGLIFEDGDRIFDDEEELEFFINDMVSLYEMKVVSFENDIDFSSVNQDITLENDFLDNYFKDPKYRIKQLVRDSSINKKYLLSSLVGVTLFIGGFLFFYEDDLYNEIINETLIEEFSIMSKDLKKYKKEIKKNEKRKTFTQKEITELGIENFKNHYESHFFENKNIINNVLFLDNNLQRYAMEWELEKLVYVDNKFLLIYNKIQGSIGVFTDLDLYINRISNSREDFNIKPVELTDSGKKRIYEVSFGKNLKEKQYLARLFEEKNKISKDYIIEDLEKKVNETKSDASFITENVMELNIFQRIFTNDVLEAYGEIEMLITKSKKVYDQISEEINREEKDIALVDNSLAGSELKYVEISQRDSLFIWSYPSKNLVFPDSKLLTVRGKSAIALKPFARSYLVELTSIEELSKGSIYMEEALIYLNKPYIKIKSIEFSKEEDMWVIVAEIYEKVYEYNPEVDDIVKESKKKKR